MGHLDLLAMLVTVELEATQELLVLEDQQDLL